VESTAVPAPSRALTARLDLLEERMESLGSGVTEQLDRTLQALELLIDDEPRGRRRLSELRASSAYEEAYSAPSPLVSVIIPTWNRTESLTTRAIPSVLAQTYDNVEVVVVGDASPPELGEAVRAIDDPRVRFQNLTVRGPYDEDSVRAWCASGTPPMNAGLEHARGHWVTCIGDDDALSATHVETLLSFARSHRLEFACGWFRYLGPDGVPQMIGSFPPRLGHTGLQISLWHAGLRFLQFELAHSLFTTPNDWGLIRRMMRIGVSMGQTDDVIVDYTPSGRGHGFGAPTGEQTPELRRQITELREQLYVLGAEREDLDARLSAAAHSSDLARNDFERRLDDVVRSKSWRMTAPLRRMTDLKRRFQNRRRDETSACP
jgi:hypothetical protein